MPNTYYTRPLPIFKAKQRGICPWCHTFITKGSIIVKLDEPQRPDTKDGRFCNRTGSPYHYDGRSISTHPREYAHWDCYKDDLIRDAKEYDGCWYCESHDDLTIDHIKPTSLGGPDTPGNVTVACRSCNSSKHTRTYDEFVATLPEHQRDRIYNY